MRLLVVSHTAHFRHGSAYAGWGPTVRELDYLSELFDEVVHVAPLYDGEPPSSMQPYASGRVRLRPVAPAGGESLGQKLGILLAYPAYAAAIRDEMARADAVHVRCPANISLLALLILRLSEKPAYRWVKYAGNWQPDGAEPWSYGLQRRWLADNMHRGVVTVNGRWPNQPPHVVSFYNPCLSADEVARGSHAAAGKRLDLPVELLFVGALNEWKGVGRVLEVARLLQRQGITYRLRLLGDGPDRGRYGALVHEHGLHDVEFLGWVPRATVGEYYAAAHFILLPSRSEGWPKVLSEAMAYGVVPVAAAVSSIPQILGATRAGVAFPPDDTDAMAGAIAQMVHDPGAWRAASQAGVAAARQFTYRAYQEAVADLFRRSWAVGLSLPDEREAETPPLAAPEPVTAMPRSANGHVKH